MTRRAKMFRAVCLVLFLSATLPGCHELYCSFVEGLTGVPVDCSHDEFPDLGIDFPPLPPPPSLPTTTTTSPSSTTTTTTSTTTTTLPPETTTTSSSTTTSTSTSITTPGASLTAGDFNPQAVTDALLAARERLTRR